MIVKAVQGRRSNMMQQNHSETRMSEILNHHLHAAVHQNVAI